jgi:hypothetical protein
MATMIPGSVASLVMWAMLIVAVGCHASARPVRERANSVPSHGTPSGAGGTPTDAVAALEQPRRGFLGVLQYCADRLGLAPSEKDIHQDDSVAMEQAKFLDHDLNVPLLRRRSGVAFANVIQTVDSKRLHIGVVEFAFRRCQDLDAAFNALSKIGRTNFNVAALSVFRSFRRANTLVILFSETPFHPKVRALLDSAAQQAPGSARCKGG